jgi:polysaccharide biosynthesis/export protein
MNSLLCFPLRFAVILLVALPATIQAAPPVVANKAGEAKIIPYRLARGDRLSVAIFGEANLTAGGKRVEARGTIPLALVGDVRVVGLTISEAQTAIENAYRDGRILRYPQVTITMEEYARRVVSVFGKIKMPGTIELPPEQQMTIKELILKQGGFEDTARGTAVKVTRTLPDGTTKVFVLDVQSAILGKDRAASSTDASFVLEPDDVIYVPEKII